MNTKPLLYNGYKLPDGVIVQKRIERAFFIEVYQLDNGRYLYLFLKQSLEDISSERTKSKLITLHIGTKSYLGLVHDEFSEKHLADFQDSLSELRGFDAVAGMEKLKSVLYEEVIEPIQNPEKFQRFKLSIPNGILFFGPPGCGKTFIVRKLAEEIGYNFVELKHSDIGSMYVHETASKIAKHFESARANSPSILFVDEISGLVPKRENIGSSNQYKEEEVNEFLMQLEHAASDGILVVGATNYPDRIDSAILRSGRMDKRIYLPPPDYPARVLLFKIYLVGRPFSEDIDFEELANLTEGYVSSDIELVVTQAARLAVNGENDIIDEDELKQAIVTVKPSLTPEEIARYEQFKTMERW